MPKEADAKKSKNKSARVVRNLSGEQMAKYVLSLVDEGRKRVILIAAAILAARTDRSSNSGSAKALSIQSRLCASTCDDYGYC